MTKTLAIDPTLEQIEKHRPATVLLGQYSPALLLKMLAYGSRGFRLGCSVLYARGLDADGHRERIEALQRDAEGFVERFVFCSPSDLEPVEIAELARDHDALVYAELGDPGQIAISAAFVSRLCNAPESRIATISVDASVHDDPIAQARRLARLWPDGFELGGKFPDIVFERKDPAVET